jgi:hypothetical protein
MNIAALGTTPTAHTHAIAAAAAGSSQGGFGAQLQSRLAGQTPSAGGATQTASLTEPGRGTQDAGRPHHQTTSTDSRAANGTSYGQPPSGASTGMPGVGASSATGGSFGSNPGTTGGLLFNDMTRGLQAYGITTAMM